MVSVEPWQYGVIAISTVGRTEVGSFLDGLSDTDIKQLHAQLGGLASDEAMTALSPLADAFRNARNAGVRKSLAKIAALVGATDATDLAKLAEDIDCCAADRIVHLIVSR